MKKSIVLMLMVVGGIVFTAAANDIRQVDFQNFAFRPSCLRHTGTPDQVEQWQLSGAGESIIVTNGVFQSDTSATQMDFRVSKVVYGDLTGDGNKEAIVTTVCNTGGSEIFSEGFIYGMVDGQPRVLAVISGGDRADGGILSATVEQGLL